MPETIAAESVVRSPREYVIQRWKAHPEAFRGSSFRTPAGGIGFLYVDCLQSPPTYFLAMGGSSDGGVAMKGDLTSEEIAKTDMQDLAFQIMTGTGGAHASMTQVPVVKALIHLGVVGSQNEMAVISVRRFTESLGDPQLIARLGPLDKLEAREADRMNASGLNEFRASFNTDALHALRAMGTFMWKDYLFYADPGSAGEARRQAADAFPLLASFMASRPSIKAAIDGRHSLQDALVKAFGNDSDGKPRMTKGILGRMGSLDWPTGDIPLERIAESLGQLPPDWFPKDRVSWDAFCDLTATVGTIMRESTDQPLLGLYESCKGNWAEFRDKAVRAFTDMRPPQGTNKEDAAWFKTSIDWAQLKTIPRHQVVAAAENAVANLATVPDGIGRPEIVDWIIRVHAPDQSRARIKNACTGVEDMVDTFARKVVLPLAANYTGQRNIYLSETTRYAARMAAARILCSGKAAGGVFELSRAFHGRFEILQEAGQDKETDEEILLQKKIIANTLALNALGINHASIPANGWPPLCPIVQAPNGVYIVSLTDPKLLKDEGRSDVNTDGTFGLNHCVGGYSGRCLKGGHHIISFRDMTENGSYKRLSTLELLPLVAGNLHLSRRQHMGYDNKDPPERAQRAYEWFLQEVSEARIPLNFDGIRRHLGTMNKIDDEILNLCGYNWREKTRLGAALDSWKEDILGKRYRKMSLDELAADPDVEAVGQIMYPKSMPGYR